MLFDMIYRGIDIVDEQVSPIVSEGIALDSYVIRDDLAEMICNKVEDEIDDL